MKPRPPSTPASAPVGDASSSRTPLKVLILNNYLLVVRPQDWLLRLLGTIHLPMIVGLAAFGLWLARGRSQGLKDRLVTLYIVFIVMCGISILYARNNYWAFRSTMDLLTWLLAGVLPMAAFVNNVTDLRRLMSAWTFAHVLVALYAQFMGNGTGPGGYLSDENDVALALCVALPYAYQGRTIFYTSTLGRIFGIACALMIAIGVVASQSRGGFVALVLTALAIIWFSPNRVRNLVLVALLGGMLYLGMSRAYLDDMATINNTQDSTRVARIYSWTLGWEIYADNPVFGVGAGNYPWRVGEYQAISSTENVLGRSLAGRVSHSLYFTLLPETGTVGALLFFSMLAIGFWRLRAVVTRLAAHSSADAFAVRSMAVAALASVLGLLSGGAFISVLYYPHFWYWLGMVIMLEKLSRIVAPAEIAAPDARALARPASSRRA